MADFWIEGFDDGLTIERWDNNGIVAADISATYGRNGNGIRLGDTPVNFLRRFSEEAFTDAVCGMAVYVVDYGGIAVLVSLTGSNMVSIKIDEASNRIGVYIGPMGTTYWGATGSLPPNSWHYVEFRATLKNSPDGSFELRVDGSTVASQSGIDTLYAANYLVTYLDVGSTVDDVYVDDLYFRADNSTLSFLGDIEIATLLPNGNGNSSGMTGSDSNQTDNYLLVDNNAAIPPATTEYVGSATQGHLDTYAMEDLAGTPTVLAVQGTLYAEMTDTGPKSIRPIIRSGSVDYSGSTTPLVNSVYMTIDDMWEDDPNTATQWTYTAVNAMEFGQEVRDL